MGRVKGLGFLPTVAKVGQVRVCLDAMLGRLGCVGHSLTPYTHLGNSAPLHFGYGSRLGKAMPTLGTLGHAHSLR